MLGTVAPTAKQQPFNGALAFLGGLVAATSVLGITLWVLEGGGKGGGEGKGSNKLRGLTFLANSCHLDSLLFAILAFPGPISQILFDMSYDTDANSLPSNACSMRERAQIRAELKRIFMAMHQPKSTNYTCQNLRLIFGQCQNLRAHVGDLDVPGVLQDPKDTWMLLLKVFPLQQTGIMIAQTKRFLVESNLPHPKFLPTQQVTSDTTFTVTLVDVPGLANQLLSKSLQPKRYSIDNGKDEYAVTEYKFQVPYLVFDVQRLRFKQNNIKNPPEILKTKIVPDEKLDPQQVESVIHPETPLQLQSIVAYAGYPHYVAFARHPTTGTWYFYNDIGSPPLERVGNYQQLLRFQKQLVPKLGVLFFYW